MASDTPGLVHLIRHGEVDNPDGVVYAALPGFPLTARGRRQARESAEYLASRPIAAVWSSPLDRAMQTAAEIAAPHGRDVVAVAALAEWGLSDRWSGRRWVDVPPSEKAGYWRTPWDLPFSPESLDAMAGRIRTVVEEVTRRLPGEEVALVSHQDPIQAVRVALLGLPVEAFLVDRPSHAEVITLAPGTPWREVGRWRPPTKSETFPPEGG
jgi:broad specificity phosphatase PhoE